MKLSHVFLGAALVAGAQTAPALYYMASAPDTVTTEITGITRTDAFTPAPGRRCLVETAPQDFFSAAAGSYKFDTFGNGDCPQLKTTCTYAFSLNGAHVQAWPPSYSRSITQARLVRCRP